MPFEDALAELEAELEPLLGEVDLGHLVELLVDVADACDPANLPVTQSPASSAPVVGEAPAATPVRARATFTG